MTTKKVKNHSQKQLHAFVILAYKESPYLEACIKSVLQNKSSQVIIATTTNNKFIRGLAKKYNIGIITGKHTNIGGDFDFAVNATNTPLVTVAHQDDIYEKNFSTQVIKQYHNHPDATIIFTDYFEVRDNKKIYQNTNLKIKRTLLLPFRFKKAPKSQFLKRSALRFGNAICCPSATFIRPNCPKKIFYSKLKCNIDWQGWERLSRRKGRFIYIPQPLMGHRISEASTTTDIINQGIRTKEDFKLFQLFWPKCIAKILTKVYRKSEKSNNL